MSIKGITSTEFDKNVSKICLDLQAKGQCCEIILQELGLEKLSSQKPTVILLLSAPTSLFGHHSI